MKIRDASGWTMFVFGILAFLFGLLVLIRYELTLFNYGFDALSLIRHAASDYRIILMMASSIISLNVGICYVLAALKDLKKFYFLTVPFRTITFIVFTTSSLMRITPMRFIGVGAWSLLGALCTGIALYYENKGKY